MAKRIIIGFLAGLLLLSGCSTNEKSIPSSTPSDSAISAAAPITAASGDPIPDGGNLLLLPDLVGKDDDAVVEALGDGTVRFKTDGKTIDAREYSMEVLNFNLEVSALYEKGVISHFDVYIPGAAAETWKRAMTQWFGQPKKIVEKNKETSSTKTVYEQENVRIVLIEAYDTLSVLIEPADAQ